MKNVIFLLASLTVLLADTKIIPYGVPLGEKLDKNLIIKNIQTTNAKTFLVKAPKPINNFEEYFVDTFQDKALNAYAKSVTFENDEYCNSSRNLYKKLKIDLNNKYGIPTYDLNYLNANSNWNDKKYYKMSLYRKDRLHFNIWGNEEFKIILRENAEVKGCYVVLTYVDKELDIKKKADLKKSL